MAQHAQEWSAAIKDGGAATPPQAAIRIRGARVHNLRDIDVDIPHDQLIVLTGPSGSGKSSLAFDTLYAEGKRQYIESLSAYARQFLDQVARPDVDLVDGLLPTLCIDQRPLSQNPRSTVATVTEVYDYLRLLMARLGLPTCYRCGAAIQPQSLEQIVDRLAALGDGTKAMILAPLVRGRKGKHADVFHRIRKSGFVRVRVDGLVCELDQAPELAPRKPHQIDLVIDRIIIRDNIRSRLVDSARLALEHGDGVMAVCYLDERPAAAAAPEEFPVARNRGTADPLTAPLNGHPVWRDELFSTRHACPTCQVSYEEIEPRTFSFNSPYGACPVCQGLGLLEAFDPQRVIPDRQLSLRQGAIAPWKGSENPPAARERQLARFLAQHQASVDTPLDQLPPTVWERLLHGDDALEFPGVLLMLEQELATCHTRRRSQELQMLRAVASCETCGGSRLRREALAVHLAGKSIHDITRLSIADAQQFFRELRFPEHQRAIAAPLLDAITKRLSFLTKVGVCYLSLERGAETLSGGEFQRVRLATSIGSGLVGVCYVLDEPSIGLHSRDNQRLIDALRDLQQQGNTVLVVEHDDAMIRAADHVLDMGPGAGAEGGRVVALGTPREIQQQAQSLTGDYLSGRREIPMPATRRRAVRRRSLLLQGVSTHNLKHVDVRIPLGVLVCVTGVSGSGKSSLVNETLAPALAQRLAGQPAARGSFQGLRGASQLDKVIQIDQSPIGRSPRSNAATYTGVFDEIRKVYAGTREAKQRGFTASRFSFNNKAGRCESCQGQGWQKLEMSFLPDLDVLCDECGGARFNRQTLQVSYRGKTIADILELSVAAARKFFENFAQIARVLESLQRVGLGYLPLGQPSTTLSGGEAQRIKLATELARVDTGQTLYLLDEPTTGLHFEDIRRLMDVLQGLVDKGNTALVIEHNLDVIKCADWVIDLGPEGGAEGGWIVAEGTPEDVAGNTHSHTGRYLQAMLPARSSDA